MARAYGKSSALLGLREATKGTAATGNYLRLPFTTCALGSEQPLIDDDTLGFGTEDLDPFQDVISSKGQIKVPLDLSSIGWWLSLALGDPDTTGSSDPYTHVWTSGADADTLPLATLEVQHPKVPAFYQQIGAAVGSIAFEWSRSGGAYATMDLVARKEVKQTSSQGGTPVALTFQKVSQFKGSIKRGGTLLANLTGGSLKYDLVLEEVQTIRDDAAIEAADATRARVTGGLTARFADTTLIDLASAGTPIDLEYAYTLSASRSLVFTIPRVFLPKPKTQINGPGGIEISYDWQAAQNIVSDTRTMTVTLKNGLDGTDYVDEG